MPRLALPASAAFALFFSPLRILSKRVSQNWSWSVAARERARGSGLAAQLQRSSGREQTPMYEFLEYRVSDFISRNGVVVSANTPLEEAQRLFAV
jgi:hypothetical protein